jgi:hypothetical protein
MVRLHQREPKCQRIVNVVDDDGSSDEEIVEPSRDKVLGPVDEVANVVIIVAKEDVVAAGTDADVDTVMKTTMLSPIHEASMSEASDVGNIDPSGKCLVCIVACCVVLSLKYIFLF